jgi:GT2 family glycosyltransferase
MSSEERSDEGVAARADVIILSWNRVEDTIAAVRSAAEQKGVAKRILIVDQGSEPDNLATLEQFLDAMTGVDLRKLDRNAGVAGGRNIATAMGQAPYVVALDSDAVFADSHTLARAVRHLDADPRLGAIGFRITNYFTGENDAGSWDYPAPCRPDERFLASRIVGAGHAIRRSLFEAVGGYDDRLFFCGEELDLCYRMINAGYRIEYVPDVAVLHKVSPDHRVYWGRGRYYFTVRNSLYSAYKFGTPLPRLATSAIAYLAKGLYNGIPGEAIRAIPAAIALCRAFDRSAEDKSAYRLAPETWRYIIDREPSRTDGVVTKIRRQFGKLPHQA